MKIWKLIGITVVCMALIFLIGCGKAEEEPAIETQTEPEVVEAVVVDYTPAEGDIGTEIICGICGMKMAVTADMPAATYEGENYYFCTDEEKAKFAAAPTDFIKKGEEAVEETREKLEETTGN